MTVNRNFIRFAHTILIDLWVCTDSRKKKLADSYSLGKLELMHAILYQIPAILIDLKTILIDEGTLKIHILLIYLNLFLDMFIYIYLFK